MGKEIGQAVNDAASNVACEVGDVPMDVLLSIREQLEKSIKSDESFIYGLYKTVIDDSTVKEENNLDKEHGHARKI